MIQNLIDWYRLQNRSLPWRDNTDPYRVWLSEIILQQTRIAQGLPYFQNLVEAYPSVQDLASAQQDEVYALWQGLGYYSRCKNMHLAAKIVSTELQGVFPDNYTALLELPGVGPYTAAAIASICYGEKVLALDGNLQRVLSRLYGIREYINTSKAKQSMHKLGEQLLQDVHAGELNQALMDLGSQICTPQSPDCGLCPLRLMCYAYKEDVVEALPLKKKKKTKKEHYIHYAVAQKENMVWIRKRSEKGIWQNLYEFDKVYDASAPYTGDSDAMLEHQLTHKKLYISFESTSDKCTDSSDGIWVAKEQIADYALPVPLKKWWQEFYTEQE